MHKILRLFNTKGLSSGEWQQRTLSGLLIGLVLSFVILFLWQTNAFAQIRLRLNDAYFVPIPTQNRIAIIAIDDHSLAEYGRSPTGWSREIFATLTNVLSEDGARVITFDILFVEGSENDDVFIQALTDARQSDTRTRIVMPIAGVQQSIAIATGNYSFLFEEVLRPNSTIAERVDHLGIINTLADSDGVIRRQFGIIETSDEQFLSLSLATFVAYLRIPQSAIPQIIQVSDNRLEIAGTHSVLLDENGMWRPNYFGPPSVEQNGTYPVYSLRDVVNGEFPEGTFTDKIVFIGTMNSVGVTDQHPTPTTNNQRLMAGVEIHANATETILQQIPIHEESHTLQAISIVLLTTFASVLYANIRWSWIFIAAITLTLVWLLYAFFIYATTWQITNLLHPIMGIAFAVPLTLGYQVTNELNRRRQVEFLLNNLTSISGERLALPRILARIANDLKTQVGIQDGEIWLKNVETNQLEQAYRWTNEVQLITRPSFTAQLAHKMLAEKKQVVSEEAIALPLSTQDTLWGALIVIAKESRRRNSLIPILSELTQKISPTIENAQLHAQTEQQRSLLDQLITGSPSGILLLDNDLIVKRLNAAASKALQYSPTDEDNQALRTLLTRTEMSENDIEHLLMNFERGGAFRAQVKISDDSLIIDAAHIRINNQWIVTLNNVTALAKLNELRTKMIRMASHDLKNPLTAIMVSSSLLKMFISENGASQTELLETNDRIYQSSKFMQRLIDDILALEKTRSQQMLKGPFYLTGLVNEVIAQHKPDIELRHQTLIVEIASDVPAIYGSRREISQAFTNLVGNASKYTPQGGTITVRLYHENKHILFETQDTGYGIPESDQKNIFQEFYRARTTNTANIEGTGLGLSLVQSIITAHDGKIWFKSEEGKGTTFFIQLPQYEGDVQPTEEDVYELD